MKIRKMLVLTMVVVLVMALLAGCGAEKATDNYYGNAAGDGLYDMAGEIDSPMAPESVGTSNSKTEVQSNSQVQQKLIKTVDMSAETEDLNKLLDDLSRQVGDLGGYVESRNVYNGSSYNSSRSRNADLTIRIPAENLDGFVSSVQGMSNIISVNEKVQDVTLTYVAVESRMEALETERDRLMELMEQAVTMSDLLEVEARLTDVLSELESVTSQLRVLENQVSYATVHLYIREVQVLTVVEEETVWQRMTRGFGENLRGLGNFIVEFAIFLVVSLPYLVPLAGIVVVAVVLLRRRKTKKKAVKAVTFETEPPENKE